MSLLLQPVRNFVIAGLVFVSLLIGTVGSSVASTSLPQTAPTFACGGYNIPPCVGKPQQM